MKNKGDFVEREGLPPVVLLPAKNYFMRIERGIEITIPKEGNLHDLNSALFSEDEPFKLSEDLEDEISLAAPLLTRVLFAIGKYPELSNNELFAITGIFIGEDTVSIVGNVIQFFNKQRQLRPYAATDKLSTVA